MVGWLVSGQGIGPHISAFDTSTRADGTFSRADFTDDQPHDVYRCPAGRMLATTGTLANDGVMLMPHASEFDCAPCPPKARCCPNKPERKLPRSVHEGARDMARDLARTEDGETARRERKKVDMVFAHFEHVLKLDRLRLRGPNGARDEFHLAAAAQNLRKSAEIIPVSQPSPA